MENEGMRMYAFVVCRKVTKEALTLTRLVAAKYIRANF